MNIEQVVSNKRESSKMSVRFFFAEGFTVKGAEVRNTVSEKKNRNTNIIFVIFLTTVVIIDGSCSACID